MRHLLCIAAIALFIPACDGYYDPDGVILGEACDQPQKVNSIRPRDGAEDAYGAGYVVVTLACPLQSGVIAVRTVTDEPVTGLLNLHHEGRQVRFRASPPLLPSTTYDAFLDTPDGFREWRFRTSELGRLTNRSDLSSTALSLRAGRGVILDPPGLNELLEAEFADFNVVLQLTSDATGATVNTRLGGFLPSQEGDPQDPVQPVIDGTARWDDPVITFGPVDLQWQVRDWTLVLEQATWTVALDADLSGGGGGQLEAMWDVRDVSPVFGEEPCVRAAAFGTPCSVCADGVPACLPFLLVHTPANPWFGTLTAN